MDDRIITVLKAISYGDICRDDEGNYWCDFCSLKAESDPYDKPIHADDCPVMLARQVLKEQNTPLLLYRIDYEYYTFWSDWQKWTHYKFAFDEEEARIVPTFRQEWRNIQVTVVGEA